jgi:hypothetical protein
MGGIGCRVSSVMTMPVLIRSNIGTRLRLEKWDLDFFVHTEKPFSFPAMPDWGDCYLLGNHIYTMKLPSKERKIKKGNYRLVLDNNPNFATVNHKTNTIIFDKKKWYSLKKYERLFVLLHEHAHKYYKSEWKCDVYAIEYMLKKGFPKSVIIGCQLKLRPYITDIHRKTVEHFNKKRKKK